MAYVNYEDYEVLYDTVQHQFDVLYQKNAHLTGDAVERAVANGEKVAEIAEFCICEVDYESWMTRITCIGVVVISMILPILITSMSIRLPLLRTCINGDMKRSNLTRSQVPFVCITCIVRICTIKRLPFKKLILPNLHKIKEQA